MRIWHGQKCELSSMISSRVFSSARRQAVQHCCGLHGARLRRVRTTPSVATSNSVVYFAGCAALRSARRLQASGGNSPGRNMCFMDSRAHGNVLCIAAECGGLPCQQGEVCRLCNTARVHSKTVKARIAHQMIMPSGWGIWIARATPAP